MKKIIQKLFLINLLSFLILFEVLVSYVLKEYNIMTLSRYSTISQNEFRAPSSYTEFKFSENYKKKFMTLIKNDFKDIEINEHTIETATRLREHLLDLSFRKNENYIISRYPDEIYQHLKNNGYLLCGEIARLYGYILNVYGFKVRYLTVARFMFDSFDRHSTIEIWDEKRGKWIISDPTFNISFKKDTVYLSADELYDLIHSGNFNAIEVVHGKRTKYEYQINHYYISYYSLLNNIFYIKHIEPFRINELPPLRWLDNDYKIYLVQSNEFPVRSSGIKIQNSIMFFVLFLNPILIIALFLLLILDEIKIRKFKFMSLTKPQPALIKILRNFKS